MRSLENNNHDKVVCMFITLIWRTEACLTNGFRIQAVSPVNPTARPEPLLFCSSIELERYQLA